MSRFKRIGSIISLFLFSGFTHVNASEIDKSVLPIAAPQFEGKIGKTFDNSKQDYPQPIKAPKVHLMLWLFY